MLLFLTVRPFLSSCDVNGQGPFFMCFYGFSPAAGPSFEKGRFFPWKSFGAFFWRLPGFESLLPPLVSTALGFLPRFYFPGGGGGGFFSLFSLADVRRLPGVQRGSAFLPPRVGTSFSPLCRSRKGCLTLLFLVRTVSSFPFFGPESNKRFSVADTPRSPLWFSFSLLHLYLSSYYVPLPDCRGKVDSLRISVQIFCPPLQLFLFGATA